MKKHYRVHKTLSNGQILSAYFQHSPTPECFDGCMYPVWMMGLRIGKTRRDNNDWYNDDKRFSSIQTTGNCGIEGLMLAKDILMTFIAQHSIGTYQKMVIIGADEQRTHVYSYLLRLGFKEYEYNTCDKAYVYEF